MHKIELIKVILTPVELGKVVLYGQSTSIEREDDVSNLLLEDGSNLLYEDKTVILLEK